MADSTSAMIFPTTHAGGQAFFASLKLLGPMLKHSLTFQPFRRTTPLLQVHPSYSLESNNCWCGSA
jgi:hypothetical protein